MKKKKISAKTLIILAIVIAILTVGILIISKFSSRKKAVENAFIYDNNYCLYTTTGQNDYSCIINAYLYKNNTHKIISINDQEAHVEISAPNMEEIINSILEGKNNLTEEKFIKKLSEVLEEKNYEIITKEATLKIVKNKNKYYVEPTESFYDAMYGGLYSMLEPAKGE